MAFTAQLPFEAVLFAPMTFGYKNVMMQNLIGNPFRVCYNIRKGQRQAAGSINAMLACVFMLSDIC